MGRQLEESVREYAREVVEEAISSSGGMQNFLQLPKSRHKKNLRVAQDKVGPRYPEIMEAVEDLRLAFKAYRTPKNKTDITAALNSGETVQFGYDALRQIGVETRTIRTRQERKARIAKVAADMQSVNEHQPAEPKPRSEYGSVTNTYRRLADTCRILPNDEVVAILMGCAQSAPGGIRRRLTDHEGYVFEPMSVPDGHGNYRQWRVVRNASDIARDRELAMIEQAEQERLAKEAEQAEQEQLRLAAQATLDQKRQEEEEIQAEAIREATITQDALLAALLQKLSAMTPADLARILA